VKKTRQNKTIEPASDGIRSGLYDLTRFPGANRSSIAGSSLRTCCARKRYIAATIAQRLNEFCQI
ncbi:hypothetical protein, partial [Nitrobacter sp.]|uniref:hypothetical protein n=1 Tax=Nitrobacter sp. TaxID=29420 RepID=UPI001DE5972A